MRIASNKITDIVRFFREELHSSYEKQEIETFIAYCFEEFISLKRADIFLNLTTTVSESDLLKFNFAVKDLKQFKPIQYILGKADFYGLKFYVNKDVLIPRPETEELVHLIINDLKRRNPLSIITTSEKGDKLTTDNEKLQIKILDIGTGSGCISIALKKNIIDACVYALDISDNALNLAAQNAKLNAVDVEFFQADILSDKPLAAHPNLIVDIIVSNPPYICITEKAQMEKNVVDYEPHLALFVEDADALIFYKAIADFALKYLKKGGQLYFEINQAFSHQVQVMLVNKGFLNVFLIKDLNNNYRIIKSNL